MRWLLFLILSATAITLPPADTQENVVQEFSGSGSTTTGLFKVHDRWEVRWNARQLVSVAVMSEDGTIVAGAAGVLRGSLFVPLGGQYYLKISDGTVPPLADTNSAPAASTNAAPTAGTNAPAASTNAAPPATVPPPIPTDSTPPPAPDVEVSWHLQVVELGTSATANPNQALTVYTPFFIVPDSAVMPVAPPPEPPPPVLTDDQTHALVTIKGDNAQGTGFLMRSPDGTFVATHLHLLAANPNIIISTAAGAQIKTLSLKGAIDRDLALFQIEDNHYSYLPLPATATDATAVGDRVMIPVTDSQTDLLVAKPEKVIAVSPERLDFDARLKTASSGAPVIDIKSGKVLAVATVLPKADVSDSLAKAWPTPPAPGPEGSASSFGVRLTGVQGWETYDWSRFLAETLFLKQFHEDTRCLDSYLNGGSRHHRHGESGDNEPADDRYFLTNSKLREASDTYKRLANGADENQRLDAARELLFDLDGVAETNVSTLQGMTNLYAFDRNRVPQELAYRKAIKKQLDGLGDKIVLLDNLARSR